MRENAVAHEARRLKLRRFLALPADILQMARAPTRLAPSRSSPRPGPAADVLANSEATATDRACSPA